VVSARKYRPKEFSEVVGQKAITDTLVHSIANNHLAQALLFCGPRGVGKTTCARILARKINEEIQSDEQEDFAFNIFELDAASNNSVDDIRTLIEQVRFAPQRGKYKVYIIDEVHMLSQAAFNAFLKTLEEPPSYAVFILATTEKHKIIPTILSRCQIYDFKRITVTDIKNHLKTICQDQKIVFEDDALHLIAQKADGALRDALSIFDRVVSFSENELTAEKVAENLNILDYETYFTIVSLALEGDIQGILLAYDSVVSKGFEGHLFISGLAVHFRDLLVSKEAQTISLLEVGELTQKKYLEQAQKTSINFLMNALEICSQAELAYRESKNQRLTIEIALMQLASLTEEVKIFKKKRFKVKAPQRNQVAIKESSKTQPQKIVIENTSEPPQKTFEDKPRRRSGLSIKSAMENKEAPIEKTHDKINLPKDFFEQNDAIRLWKEYLETLKKSAGLASFNALSHVNIRLEKPFTLWFEVSSNVALEEFNQQRNIIDQKLKKGLNNYEIKLETKIVESNEEVIALSPKERYEFLSKKSKNLNRLIKNLGLDIYG